MGLPTDQNLTSLELAPTGVGGPSRRLLKEYSGSRTSNETDGREAFRPPERRLRPGPL